MYWSTNCPNEPVPITKHKYQCSHGFQHIMDLNRHLSFTAVLSLNELTDSSIYVFLVKTAVSIHPDPFNKVSKVPQAPRRDSVWRPSVQGSGQVSSSAPGLRSLLLLIALTISESISSCWWCFCHLLVKINQLSDPILPGGPTERKRNHFQKQKFAEQSFEIDASGN